MDSRKYIAYNKTRESTLSSSVSTVNATFEPLKVLRVLIEGLPANAPTGVWLTSFKGVPVARTLSPFDLVYLDKDSCVVHSVELAKDGEFTPVRSNPSSALVLPSRSITASNTRDGDQIELRVIEAEIAEAASTPAPARATPESVSSEQSTTVSAEPMPVTRFYSPTIMGSAQPVYETAPEQSDSAQSLHSPAVTFPEETAAPKAPAFETAPESDHGGPTSPEIAPASASASAAPRDTKRRLVTGPIMASPKASLEKPTASGHSLSSAPEPIPFPAASGARADAAKVHEPAPVKIPVAVYPQERERGSAKPKEEPRPGVAPEITRPVPTSAPPMQFPPPYVPEATPSLRTASPAAPAKPAQAAPTALPAYSPAEPAKAPEEEPRPAQIPDYGQPPKHKLSWKIRILRWLFPELVIHEAPEPRERRRADRQSLPGLIAYFFTGGAPLPHKIGNISVTGFYLHTEERWMPGTIVRMTLQKLGSRGDDPSDTITVNSKIVRWGPDGEGFEFILTDLED
jgi:hypothetical protein